MSLLAGIAKQERVGMSGCVEAGLTPHRKKCVRHPPQERQSSHRSVYRFGLDQRESALQPQQAEACGVQQAGQFPA
jgi:hypothetical protein